MDQQVVGGPVNHVERDIDESASSDSDSDEPTIDFVALGRYMRAHYKSPIQVNEVSSTTDGFKNPYNISTRYAPSPPQNNNSMR